MPSTAFVASKDGKPMRKILLLVIIAGIVACCLFPPWVSIKALPSSNIKATYPEGYGPLWSPPSPDGPSYRTRVAVSVDAQRLSIQIGLLAFIGMCVTGWRYIWQANKKTATDERS